MSDSGERLLLMVVSSRLSLINPIKVKYFSEAMYLEKRKHPPGPLLWCTCPKQATFEENEGHDMKLGGKAK